MAEYTKEEYWQLYKKLPEELREAMFDVETADSIGKVAKRYTIPTEQLSTITRLVGNVLLGLLLPEEFQGALEKELGIKKDTAQNITKEIARFIFYPVRPALERIHNIAIAKTKIPKTEISQGTLSAKPQPSKSRRKKGEDKYREAL